MFQERPHSSLLAQTHEHKILKNDLISNFSNEAINFTERRKNIHNNGDFSNILYSVHESGRCFSLCPWSQQCVRYIPTPSTKTHACADDTHANQFNRMGLHRLLITDWPIKWRLPICSRFPFFLFGWIFWSASKGMLRIKREPAKRWTLHCAKVKNQ